MSLYKQVRKFDRRNIQCLKRNDILGVDLADYSKENGNNKGYFLLAIDYYTRKVFAVVIKNKTEKDITNALLKIFNENCYIPKNIHSDKEAGIINNKKLKELGINVYHTEFLGSPIAERCIRTLKTWIEPLRDKTPGRAWKQHLKTVVNRYNDNIHQTIKMTPNQAFYNLENDKILRANHIDFYKQEKDVPKTKLKIDDTVITLRQKGKFTKGYVRSWNTTKYKIKDIINSDPPMYKLSNGKNYYIQQLQKVEPEPEEKTKIIIRKPPHIEYNGPASRTRSILRNKK